LTGESVESCNKKVEDATETAEQKCNRESQKYGEQIRSLEDEVRRLNDSVKQLGDELQSKQRELDQRENDLKNKQQELDKLDSDLQNKQREVDQHVTAYKSLERVRAQQQEEIRELAAKSTAQRPGEEPNESMPPRGLQPKPGSGYVSSNVSGFQQNNERKDEDQQGGGSNPDDMDQVKYQPRSSLKDVDQAGETSAVAQQEVPRKDQPGPTDDRQGSAESLQSGTVARLPEQQDPSLHQPSSMNVAPPPQQRVVNAQQNPQEFPQRSESDYERRPGPEPPSTKDGSNLAAVGNQQASVSVNGGNPAQQQQEASDRRAPPGESEVLLKRDERSTEGDRAGAQDQRQAAVM